MSHPNEIAAFVRVVDRGSFVAAAEDLGLTPSGVSKIISRLEGRLGVQLLMRTTRRLALTAEGETYLLRCREILAAIEQAESEITYAGGQLRGSISVNTGTAIGRHYLAKLLPEFLKDHPQLEIELSISERQVDIVSENVDITLRAGQLQDSTIVARKISVAQRVICASPSYLERCGTPDNPEDLKQHNCIRLGGHSDLARWPFKGSDGPMHIEVRGNIITDDADTMLDLAIDGHGIIRMSDVLVANTVRQGLLVPVLSRCHISEPIPIWALTLPGRNRVPRIRMLLEFLFERLGEAPWSLDEHQT